MPEKAAKEIAPVPADTGERGVKFTVELNAEEQGKLKDLAKALRVRQTDVVRRAVRALALIVEESDNREMILQKKGHEPVRIRIV